MKELWLVMLIGGILLFVIALILMIVLKIPSAMYELSGKKAKKQLKQLQNLNLDSTTGLLSIHTDNVFTQMSEGNSLPPDLLEFISSKTEFQNELSEFKNSGSSEKIPMFEKEEKVATEVKESPPNYSFEEESTGYMDKQVSRDMLLEVEEISSTKPSVIIIEEQSSL